MILILKKSQNKVILLEKINTSNDVFLNPSCSSCFKEFSLIKNMFKSLIDLNLEKHLCLKLKKKSL